MDQFFRNLSLKLLRGRWFRKSGRCLKKTGIRGWVIDSSVERWARGRAVARGERKREN